MPSGIGSPSAAARLAAAATSEWSISSRNVVPLVGSRTRAGDSMPSIASRTAGLLARSLDSCIPSPAGAVNSYQVAPSGSMPSRAGSPARRSTSNGSMSRPSPAARSRPSPPDPAVVVMSTHAAPHVSADVPFHMSMVVSVVMKRSDSSPVISPSESSPASGNSRVTST
ncbi:hypothetical protein [Jiangella alkaliphila]|uniref:hypothetical protein n=1 Tax=Jiangella alkaliphila TaxID=419479 RepID=UPI00128DEB6D